MPKSRIALVIALMLALAACFEGDPEFSEAEQVPEDVREAEQDDAPEEGDGEDVPTAEFVAVDIDFAEVPGEVPAGDVQFVLENQGNAVHNVVLDDLDNQLVVEAQPGETETGTITLEPGEYDFHCDIPGHEQSMQGTLTVTD